MDNVIFLKADADVRGMFVWFKLCCLWSSLEVVLNMLSTLFMNYISFSTLGKGAVLHCFWCVFQILLAELSHFTVK